MTPYLTILRLTSKLSKWRSPWPPLFIPRWPPVWFTSFFKPDLSLAPWKTPKMTPYLTILSLTSKLSKWRSLWPPLFTPRWPPVWFTSFFNPDLSLAPWKTPKMTPYLTILRWIGCTTFTVDKTRVNSRVPQQNLAYQLYSAWLCGRCTLYALRTRSSTQQNPVIKGKKLGAMVDSPPPNVSLPSCWCLRG